MLAGDVSSIDVVSLEMFFFSINELLVIGVALSFCIFLTALSFFGVEISEVKLVGIAGLFVEVTMKSNVLSDVNILSGLPCFESDVRVLPP